MKKNGNRLVLIILILTLIGSLGSVIFITVFYFLARDVVKPEDLTLGVRSAALFISIATFVSSTLFSLLIYWNNRTNMLINDDANIRAEKERNMAFASTNYSIIECMDRMLIYPESSNYINEFVINGDPAYHMFLNGVDEKDVILHPENYLFVSVKIPFQVIEGKYVSSISFDELRFTRGDEKFRFFPGEPLKESQSYLLYNEVTQRRNLIINLVSPREVEFYNPEAINNFSKIHMHLNITSLLSVRVKGALDLFFTNPLQIEGNLTNTYRITSSNFDLIGMPEILNRPNK